MSVPLRISATLLESFRLFMENDWFEEKELVDHIQGKFTWTPQMRLGTAYHKLVEHPQLAFSGYYEHDGYRFEREAIEGMRNRIVPGLFEVKTTKVIQSGSDEIVLVAKCDHIVGSHLDEFKTSDYFDADKYMDSVQWRMMVWMFEASSLSYHVATLAEDVQDDVVRLKGIDSLNLYPYAGLERDCRGLVADLCGYLRTKELDGYLRKPLPQPVSA